MSTPLKVFETRLLSSQSAFTGVDTQEFYVVTGSRLIVSLNILSLDPATTVTVDIKNTFSPDDGYTTLDSIIANATGWSKKVVSDFHSVFQIVTTVTGGNATYRIGVTLHDNAGYTDVDLSNTSLTVRTLYDTLDSIRLGDGTNKTNVNGNHELLVHDADLLSTQPNKLTTNAFTIASANTEQSFLAPAGTRSFLLKVRNSSAKLMISGSSGGTVYNYITVERGVVFNSGDLMIATDTPFYISSDTAGTIIEYLIWSFQ